MKLGVFIFATDYAIRPDELARAVETRGFLPILDRYAKLVDAFR